MIPRYRAWDKEFKEMVQVDALVSMNKLSKQLTKWKCCKRRLKNYVTHAIHRPQR